MDESPVSTESRGTRPEQALIPPSSLSFARLIDAIHEAPASQAPDAVPVLGKRVSKKIGRGLAKFASETILNGFSVFEIARIIQDPRFGLERYMEILAEIRDNPETPARDRIAAADKVVQTILSVVGTAAGELKQITSSEPPQNLMQVLVQVQGGADAIQTAVRQLPLYTEGPGLGGTETHDRPESRTEGTPRSTDESNIGGVCKQVGQLCEPVPG